MIFSSSIAAYGEPTADIIDETTPWTWSNLQPGAALYAASKSMGENIGKLYHDRHGVKSVSLRYSSVYGERQHLRAVNSVYIIDTYDRLKRGERPIIPDDGREVHDYIHVADVARANLVAMESDVSRERTTPSPVPPSANRTTGWPSVRAIETASAWTRVSLLF